MMVAVRPHTSCVYTNPAGNMSKTIASGVGQRNADFLLGSIIQDSGLRRTSRARLEAGQTEDRFVAMHCQVGGAVVVEE